MTSARDWILLAVVAATPLAALPMRLGPAQAPITELMLPLAIVSVLVYRRQRRGRLLAAGVGQREAWPVALFLIAALLSLLVTEYPRQSLRELRLVILEPVTLYALLRASALDLAWLRRTVTSYIGVVAVMALIAFGLALSGRGLVEAEGVQRLAGPYPSANHFALELERAIPFGLALALIGGPHRLVHLLTTLLLLIALAATFSGGGWIGTAAAVLTVVWLARGRSPALALLALGGVTVGAALALLRVERVASRIDPTRGTGFLRIKLWESSLAMLRDHPFLGVGLDNFLYRYQQEYLLDEAAVEPNLSHPHNWLLNFWLSLGALGLITVIWLLLQFAGGVRGVLNRSADPSVRALAIGATGSMVTFLVHGSVDNSYFLPDMALIFWFTLAVPRILRTAVRP